MRPLLLLLALAGCPASIPDDSADTDDTDVEDTDDTDVEDTDDTDVPEPVVLVDHLDIDALVGHLEMLEGIADANGGTRVYTSQGYLDSVDYVSTQLEAVGYEVCVETYEVTVYEEGDSALTVEGDAVEHAIMTYSGAGDVTGPLVPVDLQLPPGSRPNSSTSGCEADDFADFPSGGVALIQRGSCTFAEKVSNAAGAGAVAVVLFNEGQSGRRGVVQGVLDETALSAIPAVGISFDDGEALAGRAGDTVRVQVESVLEVRDDRNVFATLPGDESRKVVIGAHLDSVAAGPGINDNGSGSAYVLELALIAAREDYRPVTTLEFAWWGAEEQGLVGSRRAFLTPDDEPNRAFTDAIDVYLNFDMLASGNGVPFLYDGNGDSIDDGLGTAASGEVEAALRVWFDEQGIQTVPTGMALPTDSYWPALLGIPTGGLFSGAFEEKTPAWAEAYGGVAGEALDACYHRACDRLTGIDAALYEDLAMAATVAVQDLSERTEPLREGVERRRMPDLPKPRGCHDEVRWDR